MTSKDYKAQGMIKEGHQIETKPKSVPNNAPITVLKNEFTLQYLDK